MTWIAIGIGSLLLAGGVVGIWICVNILDEIRAQCDRLERWCMDGRGIGWTPTPSTNRSEQETSEFPTLDSHGRPRP